MPAPPPPPPPPSQLAKATLPKAKAGVQSDRAALLKSIQNGTTLKKTVTNDRSTAQFGKSESRPSKACPKIKYAILSVTLYFFELHFCIC